MEGVIVTAILGASGFIIIKFFIEPYREYRKTIGDISEALVLYANVSAGTKEDRQSEANKTFRQSAARLQANAAQIPFFTWLPGFKKVMAASSALIGLSNAVYGNDWDHIERHRKKIADNLGLKRLGR